MAGIAVASLLGGLLAGQMPIIRKNVFGRKFLEKKGLLSRYQKTRPYTKGKKSYNRMTKSNKTSSTNPKGFPVQDPVYKVKHGKNTKVLSTTFINKIRDGLNPPKQYTNVIPSIILADEGKCEYQSYTLLSPNDIYAMADKIGLETDDNFKLSISDAKMTLRLQNQSSANITIRMYEWVSRYDLPDALTSVENVVENGFLTNKTDNEITDEMVGSCLYDNPQFVTYFKIVRDRTFVLTPNKVVSLVCHDPKTQTINGQIINNAFLQCIRNVTKGYVIQVTGQIANATDNALVTTTTAGKLSVIATWEYTFKQPQDNPKANYYAGGLVNAANTTFVNEATGAVVNPVFA